MSITAYREKPIRRSLSIWICFFLLGCYAPPSVLSVNPDAVPPAPATLRGINSQARSPSIPIRILFVHGMGTDPAGQSAACTPATLIAGLTRILGVAQVWGGGTPVYTCGTLKVPPPTTIVVNAPLAGNAQLFEYNFSNSDGLQVRFDFLLWSPVIEPFRQTVSEPGHPSWALSTDLFKSFAESHLSDVVLYGGTFRNALRPVVEKALCDFVGGVPDSTGRICNDMPAVSAYRTVLLTHSLGGYMLLDAIADLRAAHLQNEATNQAGGRHDAAAQALGSAELIFMMANQLALLDLSAVPAAPPVAASGKSATPMTTGGLESQGILAPLLEHWKFARGDQSLAKAQLVAISDPNDWLTWLVSRNNIPLPTSLTAANVYLGTTPNYFGITAWPVSAHLNYLTDPDVSDIIGCGMTGNSINRCGR